MKDCIDPGHSGAIEPGACGQRQTRESDIVLSVSRLVRELLVAKGHEVVLTRESEVGDDRLTWRGLMAAGCDVFVSIHCNSAESRQAHGSEVWLTENASDSTKLLASFICSGLAGVTGEDRGLKYKNFTVIRVAEEQGAASCLAELEFISNDEGELSLINNQQAYAQAIASAIIAYTEARGIQ